MLFLECRFWLQQPEAEYTLVKVDYISGPDELFYFRDDDELAWEGVLPR